MTHRLSVLAFVLLAAAAVAGCASTPPNFYTLSAAAVPQSLPSDLSVSVGPISVPALVDRPEIVSATGNNQVKVDEFNRWAAPLRDDIARVVAENLVLMLGTPQVTQTAQTASAGTRYRVIVEVQRLEAAPGEWAVFDALWTVRRTGDGQSLTGRTRLRQPLDQGGYAAVAAAYSQAVARLSEEVAAAVRTLARG
jgi:uncharacterized protein